MRASSGHGSSSSSVHGFLIAGTGSSKPGHSWPEERGREGSGMKTRWAPFILLAAVVPLMIGAAQPKPVAFADARVIIEVNDTDGDAGLQIFVDAEAWRQVAVFRPDGQQITDFRTAGPVNNYGLTELFSESSEPPFEVFPLEQFKALFPEGVYRFTGTTISGATLAGSATLSHDIPDGPDILFPEDGARIAREEAVVQWEAGSQPAGVEIVGYQVVVTRENPHRVFTVDLPASVNALTISPEFLESHTGYALEVLAIEASGNQTLTEIAFTVR
jgi:hypothetical protein